MTSVGPTAHRAFSWLVPSIIALLAVQVYLWPHVTDDAYISFRYAWNLAHGNGLVFNLGERVEGFSNPLWTLLLAALHAATAVGIPDLARVCGILSTVALLFFAFRFVRRAGGLLAANLCLLLIILNPGFHVYASAGLEGPLLSLLLMAGLILSQASSPRSRLTAACLMGLAGITRPEGPAYAGLWFLATMQPGPLHDLLKRERIRLVVLLLPMLAWQVVRLSYFGAWLPNTAIAKVPGVFAEFINFPDYITPWLVAAGGPILLLLWLVLPPREYPLRSIERTSLAIVGGNLIFIAYAQGDWMLFGRFIVPIWPILSVPLALWLASVVRELSQIMNIRFRPVLAFAPATGIILCAFLAWQSSVGKYLANEGMAMLMRGTDQLAVGEWISREIAPTASIATGRLGGISYGARRHIVWDWFGLTDAEEAEYIRRGRPGEIGDDPVFRRRPDVIAAIEAPADWSYTRSSSLMDFLKESYIFVIAFPQGRYGSVDLWVRRDRIDSVMVNREMFVL
ncbi:MAG: hypothetical protein HBSIN02_01590 [Bacteroidia bacterium]|nr:MAG: hypothetical protein HBSIN02_01590 [Bacteroidia bacterium]